jgi:hypothetical protein
MTDARYDPTAFETLLEKISEVPTGEGPRAPAFMFNHPQSQTVSIEIAEKIVHMSATLLHRRAGPEFRAFRSALSKLPAIPDEVPAPLAEEESGTLPSLLPNVFTHPMDYYRFGYPAGWLVTRPAPNGAIIAPIDGLRQSRNGEELTHGIMFDLFAIPAPEKSLTLEQATNRLIVFLRQRNPLLRVVPGAQMQLLVSDEPALRTVLIGKSDASSEPEVAWVVTRLYYQSLFYMVFVAPEEEFPAHQPVFEQMIRSVRLR